MKLILTSLAGLAVLGCRSHHAQPTSSTPSTIMANQSKKVTGIGGIFFKCKDPEKMKACYGQNLGLVTNEYGSTFEFRSADEPRRKNYLVWSPSPTRQNISSPPTARS